MAEFESRSRGTRSLAQSPQLTEELWTNIGQHMSIKEWAKAAGACPAAWGAQCMWSIDIMADLPVAGTFRCHYHSNKALQCKLTAAKNCTRDRKRQQEALHRMPNMVSCALHITLRLETAQMPPQDGSSYLREAHGALLFN